MAQCVSIPLLSDAHAQIMIDGDNYRSAEDPLRDNRLIGVNERSHPELEPKGVDIGGITLLPEMNIAGGYVSNLLAVKDGADDAVLTVKPGLALNIPMSRFDLSVSGWIATHRYQRREDENNIEHALMANMKIPSSSSYMIYLNAGHGRFTELRTAIASPIGRERPVRFSKSESRLQIRKISGRMLVAVEASAENLDFNGDGLANDATRSSLDENRSRSEYMLSASGEYSVSPDTAIWTILRAKQKTRRRNPNRESRTLELAGGLRLKPSRLMEFSGALGYLKQNFRTPLRDVKGITIDARLKWLPTMLTTVGAGFSRKIQDQGAQAQRDFFVSEMDISVDHELRRNLIVDFSLGVFRYDVFGAGQSNRRLNLALGALYRPDRNWTISARYGRIKQTSDNADRHFTQSRFLFSVAVAT